MALAGVYKITDPETGVFYIGSTSDLERRLKQHKRDLKRRQHHSVRFQAHHGKSVAVNWEVDMVFLVNDREDSYKLEDQFLKENQDNPLMLNTSLSGKGVLLRKGSPEHQKWLKNRIESQRKMYEAMPPEERKSKWGRSGSANGMFGKTHSDAVKEASRQRATGNSWCKGLVKSPEQRAFLSRLASQRTGEKNPFFGKRHSEATKQHLSAVKKANPRLPGNVRKISINGVVYESLMAAKRATGVSQALLIHRIKSPSIKYTGYFYV